MNCQIITKLPVQLSIHPSLLTYSTPARQAPVFIVYPHCLHFYNCKLLYECVYFQGEFTAKLEISRESRRQRRGKVVPPAEVSERHAAVLGLCAYVSAFPYDVPDMLPQVLVTLSEHLNDPHPIPVSINISSAYSTMTGTHPMLTNHYHIKYFIFYVYKNNYDSVSYFSDLIRI